MINKNLIKASIGVKKEIEVLDKSIFWKEFKKASNNILAVSPKNYCKESGCAFKLNDDNRKVVKTILRYFCGDENFDEYKLVKNKASLSKGLFISGDLGVGKTKLFEIIKATGVELYKQYGFKKTLFKNISCVSFVAAYMVSSQRKHLEFNLSSFYKNRLVIDDLGVENKAFNSYELLEQLLFERHRYEALTFITTNISMTNVLERYGSRIADRIPQMCNIITWKGESFRHNI